MAQDRLALSPLRKSRSVRIGGLPSAAAASASERITKGEEIAMNASLRRKALAVCLAALVLAAAGLPFSASESHASVPKLDTIRVALFVDTGKYRANAAAVTLASEQGFSVGLRQEDGVKPLPGFAGVKKLRFRTDSYGVALLDTTDFARAKALKEQLKGSGYDAFIWKRLRQSKTVFQVWIGAYPSRAAADAAKTAVQANPVLSALVEKPALTGPLHAQAGVHASEAEAAKQASFLAQAGIDADIALIQAAGGTASYAVWVGSEADEAQLADVRARAAQVLSGLQLAPVAANDLQYLLRRDDASDSADGADALPHYAFNPAGQKVWLEPVQGRTTVAEKADRSYRGSMEISSLNNRLALVNELPFEQYLYAVVSAEMGEGWPAEALKAQAVAARTFALAAGTKYEIANVSDSSLDQAYDGVESDEAVQAVDATKGEVLMNKDGLIIAYFSANAGGMTSRTEEVWGSAAEPSYVKSVPSPDDGAAKGKAVWRRVVLSDGQAGYVHSSYLRDTGRKNAAGLSVFECTDDAVNVRVAPFADNSKNPPIGKLNKGDPVVAIGESAESNAFSWQRGPYTAAELLAKMNGVLSEQISGPLTSLEVTKRGPSGRVTELKANGQTVKVSTPDAYRSVLGGLPSTRFEIEETGRYTIWGALGASASRTGSEGAVYVLSGSSGKAEPASGERLVLLGAGGNARVTSKDTQFTFHGQGYGHGVGLSQWGARGLAELGYDYRYILTYYYEGVTIAKG